MTVQRIKVRRLMVQKDMFQICVKLFFMFAGQIAGGRNRQEAWPGIWIEIGGLRQTGHPTQLAMNGLAFFALARNHNVSASEVLKGCHGMNVVTCAVFVSGSKPRRRVRVDA
jgi:hypothetical protein